MKKTSTLLFAIFVMQTISAQQQYGSVGAQKIDTYFLECVQLLNPEFALTPKKDAFIKSLDKVYILPKSNADEARRSGLDTLPEIKAELDLLKKLAEDKFLDYLLKTRKQPAVEVTETEMQNYYAQHIAEFTPPVMYSFLKATVYDTSAATVKSVKQKLETYSRDETQLDEFKMGNKETYLIGFEKNRLIYSMHPEFKSLQGLAVKKISEPFLENGYKVMYCITSKSDATPKRFDEVKDVCRSNVQNQKQAAAQEELKKKAAAKYPVVLDADYFGQ